MFLFFFRLEGEDGGLEVDDDENCERLGLASVGLIDPFLMATMTCFITAMEAQQMATLTSMKDQVLIGAASFIGSLDSV